MSKFLVITDDTESLHATGTEAALATGFPKWDCAQASSQINALGVGDRITLPDARVVRLSGISKEFVQ